MIDPEFDELAQVLREMAGRFGETAFTDRRRLVSLLSDRMPDARREIRVVGSAVDERVFEVLARARPEQLGMEIERLAAKLENGLGIRSDIAVPVVQACAYALSLGSLPSQAAGAGAPLPMTGAKLPSQEDAWVGLSEPVRQGPPAQPAPPPAAAAAPVPAARGIPWGKWLMRAVGGVMLVLTGLYYIGTHTTPDPEPQPAPQPVRHEDPVRPVDPSPPPQPQPQPQPQPIRPDPQPPQPQPQPQPQARFFGGENIDFGVAPQTGLQSNVGSPTPLSIPGGVTVTTEQVMTEINRKNRMVLIDALGNPHQTTITGAVYLPNSGQGGNFNDAAQAALANDLNRVTQGQRNIPLVFFCLGVRCWESYNAALRARAAGYPYVFWYRGGLQAWDEAQFPMQPLR